MAVKFDEKTEAFYERVRSKRLQMQSDCLAKALPELGDETVNALKELYSLYDEKLYIWFAGLWQPEIGGFYYSNSARNTEGFLPDLESTVQALRFANTAGLYSAYENDILKALPDKCKSALAGFVKSLEDPDDGYFYHPQWGKNISISRRGRDLGWATWILRTFGVKPDYPTAIERLSNKDKEENKAIPEHFRSIEAYRKYLNEMNLNKKSYSIGNILAAQGGQIEAAGEEYIDATIEFFNKRQRSDNGLWQEEVNYDSVNGLFKITQLYSRFKRPILNPELAMGSALLAVMSNEKITFVCEFYNPWCVMGAILSNMQRFGKQDVAVSLRERIRNVAPQLLQVTMDKVRSCMKKDGSFSYKPTRSTCMSQGAPVSVQGTNEGDVNAACISSTGLINNICIVLGIDPVPMFCKEDSKVFIRLLNKATVKPKKSYEPKV